VALRDRIVELKRLDTAELEDNAGNWRTHPQAQRDALSGLLSEVGIADALLAYHSPRNDGALTLIDGHLRKEDYPGVWPVLVLDLSDAEADLLLATLDPLAAMAGAAEEQLAALLAGLPPQEAGLQAALDDLARRAGLALGEPDGPLPPAPEAQLDRGEALQQQWGAAAGQLWEIPSRTVPGRSHRLLCGDCTKAEDVARLVQAERAVLFATDPPYLVGYDGANHPHKWNEPDKNKDWSDSYHDWDDPAQGEALYDGFVAVAVAHAVAQDAAWYCWHASRNQAMVEQVWQRHGAFVHQQIVWVKDRPVLTRSWYLWQHEPCFFGWLKGHKPKRVAGDYPATVWQFPTVAPGTATDHPTSKPVELFAIPMRQHSQPGEVCYEPFAGSGSQLVAGEQLGRLVYGLEISPQYCAVILQRLADLGLQPRLACLPVGRAEDQAGEAPAAKAKGKRKQGEGR
jgi:DNA modification methylase